MRFSTSFSAAFAKIQLGCGQELTANDSVAGKGASHPCHSKRPSSQKESSTKLRNPQSRPQIHFLLDIGQSRICSTRIAAFNAGRINSKQAYRERCISLLSGFSVAIFLPRGVVLITFISFSAPGEKAGSTEVRCAPRAVPAPAFSARGNGRLVPGGFR